MGFTTFMGEVIDIDSSSFFGLFVTGMLGISACCIMLLLAAIIRGQLGIPRRIKSWVIFLIVIILATLAICLSACISSTHFDPIAEWLVYLLFLNIILGTSLCELELFKIFVIVSPGLHAKDVSLVQFVFTSLFSIGMVAQYAQLFTKQQELQWLQNVRFHNPVARLGHVRKWSDRLHNQPVDQHQNVYINY